ncbi:MAG: hypothetical protein ACKKL5_00195 [Candidatus Komeilibacteria bacterium]
MLIIGLILAVVAIIWMLVGSAFWFNWLLLIVGVILFIFSFVGKGKEMPAAPAAMPEQPAAPAEEDNQEGQQM